MLKTSLIFVAVISLVLCCEKHTFKETNVRAFGSRFVEQKLVLPAVKISGCITPTFLFNETVRIDMRYENLPTFYEGAIQDLERLEELNVDNCAVKEMQPGAFKNLPALRDVRIAGNEIKTIRTGVFTSLNISRLYLNKNQIEDIESGAFDNMPNLMALELDYNKISKWDKDWFAGTPNLLRLFMSYNSLTTLPENAFQNIKSRHDFLTYSKATDLFFSHNRIKFVHPTALSNLEELVTLDLSYNEIDELDLKTFSSFKLITNLLLNNNRFTCVPDDILNSLKVAETINFNDNPWDCQCVKKIESWGKKNGKTVELLISKLECMKQRIKGVLDSVKDV